MTITASLSTQQATTYVGQTWFDMMGNPLDETGHNSPVTAAERIAALDRTLAGKWCFALVKTKVREGGIDRWVTAILFPDGRTRKLIQGEVAVSQRTKGHFITMAQAKEAAVAAKATVEIRPAPDTRFPWRSSAVECRLERFENLLAFEKFLSKNSRPDAIIFIFEPGLHVRAPDEEILFCYLAVVPR
jgi:hypothetical protein